MAIIELGVVSEGPIILVLCVFFEIEIIGSFQKVFIFHLRKIAEPPGGYHVHMRGRESSSTEHAPADFTVS